jgi:heptose-I-phosphate ethanolaminephosphotransferase
LACALYEYANSSSGDYVMSIVLDPILQNVFIKLAVFFALIFIWKKSLRYGREVGLRKIFYFYIGLTVLSIVLSVLSIGKLYPYGLCIDIMVIQLFALFNVFVLSVTKNRKLRHIATFKILLLVSILPFIYVMHYVVVGGAVNQDSFIAVFQTSINEAEEYFQSFVSVLSVLILVIFVISLALITKTLVSSVGDNVEAKFVVKPLLVIVFLMVIVTKDKSLFAYPYVMYESYENELALLEKKEEDFEKSNISNNFHVEKKNKGETYIVVIGESLNKHHMGIYGYSLNTTPYLSKLVDSGELKVIKYSYSNYPGTMAALSYALTGANQKNSKNYLDSVSLVDVFNKANFKTVWLGNQPLSNSYDVTLGVLAKQAQTVKLTFDIEFHSMSHKDQKPDGVLIPYLKEELNIGSENNKIIFIHLMGNHTNYCDRYPEKYNVFKMPLTKVIWTKLTAGGIGHSRECYDNSVLYNDYVVSQMISLLKNYLGDSKSGALIYFADHADDVRRGVGHSSSNFSYDMLESPTVIWTSSGYNKSYPEKVKNINDSSAKLFSNDFIFDTVIGLAGLDVDKNIYCLSCDLTSADYELKPENALTMHGELPYIIPENIE